MPWAANQCHTNTHRRFNPLLESWTIVAPNRLQRPWQGKGSGVSKPAKRTENNDAAGPDTNPLAPGATRPSGIINPDYTSTFTFMNDFPTFTPDHVADSERPGPGARIGVDVPDRNIDEQDGTEEQNCEGSSLFNRAVGCRGTCRVTCFSPNSNVQLANMSLDEIEQLISEWCAQLKDLGSEWKWVQIFENKGELVGCSNPHPHCQIWACDYLPTQPAIMDRTQRNYYVKQGSQMLLDYAAFELAQQERLVCYNDDWLVVVPFWAVWPFETMLLPRKRSIKNLCEVWETERRSLASVMKELLIRYDNLFQCSFPYSMGWFNAPSSRGEDVTHWQLHALYMPPLLRSATVKKFQAGFELLCEPQRDLTPEKAASQLRQQSSIHFAEAVSDA